MRKAALVALLIAGAIVVGAAIFLLARAGVVPVPIPGARTLYTGYVRIDTLSLPEMKAKLEQNGCHAAGYEGNATGVCRYRETTVPFDGEAGIQVHPHGYGFGPLSFYLTEDRLWAVKDIPGPPDLKKFQEEVRQDVAATGNIVIIHEDSWKITEKKYPWTVIY
jgi:hypothetical protein